jgi:hypothetical protein
MKERRDAMATEGDLICTSVWPQSKRRAATLYPPTAPTRRARFGCVVVIATLRSKTIIYDDLISRICTSVGDSDAAHFGQGCTRSFRNDA